MAKSKKKTVDRRDNVEYANPFEITLTCEPGEIIAVCMNLENEMDLMKITRLISN